MIALISMTALASHTASRRSLSTHNDPHGLAAVDPAAAPAGGTQETVVVEGLGHTDTPASPEFVRRSAEFILGSNATRNANSAR